MGQLAAQNDHEPVMLFCPTSKEPLLRAWRGEITLLRKPYGGKKIDWQGGALEGCMGDEEALRLFVDGYLGKPPEDLPDYPKIRYRESRCYCDDCRCNHCTCD